MSDQTEVDRRWDGAVDWLLNSRHTADPDVQDAFWSLVDGICTEDEADSGRMADGRTVREAREAYQAGKATDY